MSLGGSAQAVFGWLLFGESLSLLWWLGASLVVVGMVIVKIEVDNDGDGDGARLKKA